MVSFLGYASSYRRNTLSPIRRIINTVDDDATKEEIDRWSRSKLKEAQYVQVAVSLHTDYLFYLSIYLSIYLPAMDPDLSFCKSMLGSYYVRVHDILSIME